LDNLALELNKQLKQVNSIVYCNKKFQSEIPYRKNISLNDIGHLEFTTDDQESTANDQILERIATSPYFNPVNIPSVYLEVKSFHILTDNMIILCQDLTKNQLRIKVFNIKTNKLGNELVLNKSNFFFKVCADLSYFLTVDSTEDLFYEIILYDENLSMLTQRKMPQSEFRIIDTFLNHHLFVLLKEKGLKLTIFGPDLNEINTIPLENIEMYSDSTDFKINVIEFHLFVCQKFLFGTRINLINYSTAEFMWKIDLCYFFDRFYVDLKTNRILFFCDGHFYKYNMVEKKVICKMTFKDLDKCICHFDANRGGNVHILLPYF